MKSTASYPRVFFFHVYIDHIWSNLHISRGDLADILTKNSRITRGIHMVCQVGKVALTTLNISKYVQRYASDRQMFASKHLYYPTSKRLYHLIQTYTKIDKSL